MPSSSSAAGGGPTGSPCALVTTGPLSCTSIGMLLVAPITCFLNDLPSYIIWDCHSGIGNSSRGGTRCPRQRRSDQAYALQSMSRSEASLRSDSSCRSAWVGRLAAQYCPETPSRGVHIPAWHLQGPLMIWQQLSQLWLGGPEAAWQPVPGPAAPAAPPAPPR